MKTGRLAVWLLLSSVLVGGCGGAPKPKPRPWNISINKTTPATIEVDLIGINALDRPAWEGYDIDKYWSPGDQRRENADKVTVHLQTGTPWTLSREDPRWQRWLDRGATQLLLIANLPGHFSGPLDPRRNFLSLDKKAWKAKDATLQIEVEDTMVHVLTPPK